MKKLAAENETNILEYFKNEPATHPQYGCSLPTTTIFIYLYPNYWRQTEYGVDTGLIRYKQGLSRSEALKLVRELMRNDGYHLKKHRIVETDFTDVVIMGALMIQP